MSALVSCRRAAELLSQGQDEPLDLNARTQLKLHLFLCRSCRHVERQLEGIRALSAGLFRGALDDEPGAPPPGHRAPD